MKKKLYPLYHDPHILIDEYGHVVKVRKKTKKQKKVNKKFKREAKRALEEWWARQLYSRLMKAEN